MIRNIAYITENINLDINIDNIKITKISPKDIYTLEKEKYDLVITYDYNKDFSGKILSAQKIINIHPSLLPAFEGENAVEQAVMSGAKVTGVTIHTLPENKIIAQYPVLIGLTTRPDEIKEEIISITKKLLPVIVDSILNDKVFDFQDFLKSGCSNGCSGCSKCNK